MWMSAQIEKSFIRRYLPAAAAAVAAAATAAITAVATTVAGIMAATRPTTRIILITQIPRIILTIQIIRIIQAVVTTVAAQRLRAATPSRMTTKVEKWSGDAPFFVPFPKNS
jgi:hypothetical protein